MTEIFTCIKCKNPYLVDEMLYCPNCGYQQNSNFCTKDTCCANEEEQIHYDSGVCFCTYCGSQTNYFKDGLIKPIPYE